MDVLSSLRSQLKQGEIFLGGKKKKVFPASFVSPGPDYQAVS